MRVFTDMNALPVFRDSVVTVGSFDGVHRGHKHLLEIMRDKACESGGETIVVTFAQHPRNVLHPSDDVRLLTSLNEKSLLLEQEGVDNLVVMPFDSATSHLSPEDFILDFVVGRLGAKELVVGYNHHFGRNKEGNAAMLHEMEKKFDFHITEAPRFSDRPDEKISSTAIRKALCQGEMRRVERLLGHPYIIIAWVGENGELLSDEPLKLLPSPGNYFVVVNGRNGTLTIAENGSVTLETSTPPEPGTMLLISF